MDMKVFGLILIIFVAINRASGLLEASKLEIWPDHNEVVRFVNDSYFVTCSAQNGENVAWYTPTTTRIPEDARGRVHSERGLTRASTTRAGALALVFEHIQLSDRGTWHCAANHTNHTAAFTMFVNDPISFADSPSKQTARENGEAELKCDARGDPVPSIVWYYEGLPIQMSGDKYQKLDKGLIITKLTVKDRGLYTCKAYQISKSVSNVQEKSITLNVQHKPIPTKQLPVSAKAEIAFGYIGGTVNLTCSAIAEPAANFTWYRKEKRVPTSEGRVITDVHLSVLEVNIRDKNYFGDYVCKAANTIGTIEWIITLMEGVRPDPPEEFYLDLRDVDALEIVVKGPKGPIGPSTLAPQPDNLPIIGYRFQFMQAPPYFKIPDDNDISHDWYNATDPTEDPLASNMTEKDWINATYTDMNVNADYLYRLGDLKSNTAYAVRVAARSVAGLSAYNSPRFFYTNMPHIASPVGSSATACQTKLPLNLLVITLFIIPTFFIDFNK